MPVLSSYVCDHAVSPRISELSIILRCLASGKIITTELWSVFLGLIYDRHTSNIHPHSSILHKVFYGCVFGIYRAGCFGLPSLSCLFLLSGWWMVVMVIMVWVRRLLLKQHPLQDPHMYQPFSHVRGQKLQWGCHGDTEMHTCHLWT